MHDPNDKPGDGQPDDHAGTEVDPDGQQVPDNQGTGTGDDDQNRGG